MRVPYLPESIRIQLSKPAGKDAPVFVYRPLNFVEAMEWSAKTEAAKGDLGVLGLVLRDLFRARVLAVELLTIGDADEPFDAKDDKHVDAILPEWVTEIGWAIVNRAQLDVDSAGKSSSHLN